MPGVHSTLPPQLHSVLIKPQEEGGITWGFPVRMLRLSEAEAEQRALGLTACGKASRDSGPGSTPSHREYGFYSRKESEVQGFRGTPYLSRSSPPGWVCGHARLSAPGITVPAPGYRAPLHPTMGHLCARRPISQSGLPFPLLWTLLPLRSRPARSSPETACVSSLCSSRS